MIIKVCGIKYRENLLDLLEEPIDMIGFNFYPESVRYVDQILDMKGALHLIPETVKKVGVFVNASKVEIAESSKNYRLDYIQLHGDEDLTFTEKILKKHKVIKVFRIDEDFNFDVTSSFLNCSYFLFDTKTDEFGGSGIKFSWERLQEYKGTVPFLLSGGISPDDDEEILKINHPLFAGIDINSKFEHSPAIKDVKAISDFIYALHNA